MSAFADAAGRPNEPSPRANDVGARCTLRAMNARAGSLVIGSLGVALLGAPRVAFAQQPSPGATRAEKADANELFKKGSREFLEGRYADVTVQPGGSPLDAAVIYLRALTDEASKRPLQAAARYQEVVDRYHDARLSDVAMLAKANVFMKSGSYKSAAEEFALVSTRATAASIQAEAKVRCAAATYLAGDTEGGADALRAVASEYDGSAVAARARC